jgi:hypothetical protein
MHKSLSDNATMTRNSSRHSSDIRWKNSREFKDNLVETEKPETAMTNPLLAW